MQMKDKQDVVLPVCPECGEEAETLILEVTSGRVIGCDCCTKTVDAWEYYEEMKP